jgi:hypothetical protein
MDAIKARQALDSAGFSSPEVDRIWDRLVRAYVTA